MSSLPGKTHSGGIGGTLYRCRGLCDGPGGGVKEKRGVSYQDGLQDVT